MVAMVPVHISQQMIDFFYHTFLLKQKQANKTGIAKTNAAIKTRVLISYRHMYLTSIDFTHIDMAN